jgi:hypothetical protein
MCWLFDQYKGYAKAMVGKGDTMLFWKDIWNFGSLQQLYPHLFSFAREPTCSVSRFLDLLPDYSRLFYLPLSMTASHQLAELINSVEEWNREANEKDQWTYIWGSGIYTSKQAYASIIGQSSVPTPFQWLWKSCCQGKLKVFFWLLLNDWLNTRNLLRRKRFNIPSTDCVLCSHNVEETLHHLFFGREFVQSCWTSLHIIWDIFISVVSMIEQQKNRFGYDCFMEAVILATWSI